MLNLIKTRQFENLIRNNKKINLGQCSERTIINGADYEFSINKCKEVDNSPNDFVPKQNSQNLTVRISGSMSDFV
jgi:hypothetical protein